MQRKCYDWVRFFKLLSCHRGRRTHRGKAFVILQLLYCVDGAAGVAKQGQDDHGWGHGFAVLSFFVDPQFDEAN